MIEVVSPTMLKMWTMCGECFRRRYILGHKIPPGIAAKIGAGLHKASEVNFKQKIKTHRDEPLDVVIDAAVDEYSRSVRQGVFFSPEQEGSAKKLIAEGVDTTVAATSKFYQKKMKKIQPVAVEQRLEMDIGGDISVMGIIDVIDDLHTPRDIKTAGKKWSRQRVVGDYQAVIYQELARCHGYDCDQFVFDIVTTTKNPATQTIPCTYNPEEFKVVKHRINLMLRSIKAGIFPPADQGHWKCSPKWCGYYFTCPYIPGQRFQHARKTRITTGG